MKSQFIEQLLTFPMLETEHWIELAKENDIEEADIERLAKHVRLDKQQVSQYIESLKICDESDQLILINELQTLHETAIKKTISSFKDKHKTVIKELNIELLNVSDTAWIQLISIFEKLQRKNLTREFLLSSLTTICQKPYAELLGTISVCNQERAAKVHTDSPKRLQKAYAHRHHREHHGPQPIVDEYIVTQNPLLAAELKKVLRIAKLSQGPQTPKSKSSTKSLIKITPGGTHVRPLYSRNGFGLFKTVTPPKKIPYVKKADLEAAIPTLRTERAGTVEYRITKAEILQRQGAKRENARSKMGASASDVFKAHGIDLENNANYQNPYHWAHQIANSFAEAAMIHSQSNQEVINLIASTAEANYNTLEAIEIFVRNLLLEDKTDEVRIVVKPIYSDDEGIIPNTLIYSLFWKENSEEKSEIHYINPTSTNRYSSLLHNAIDLLRETLPMDKSLIDTTDDSREEIFEQIMPSFM